MKQFILQDNVMQQLQEGAKIINYVDDKAYDIIVIGSRGMSSIKEVFLGSVSNYVLYKSKVTVLIVK
jgi:nucleotide-binding universal stress UspA family protein